MNGECLCRGVCVTVAARPDYINICNCRFCRSSGAAWGYYERAQVTVAGETREFTRDDIDDAWLIKHFCPTCGATTHYSATPQHPSERVGVNMRLFLQDDLAGIEARFEDGRQVDREDDDFVCTAQGRIGDGTAF